jgi:serine/threonine-protein kinase
MSLRPGTRVGAYEVVSLLGAGGMGEVYRARDTKLNRDVALKVLPSDVAGHPDRLARLRREAQTLAALNHPHIAAIYGLEDADSSYALVLEFVEGETLADRIARARVPLSDALSMAQQIADAVEAAHEKGILHRDLKPANINVTAGGRVKVLDFGLAKALSVAETPGTTMTALQTGTGIVMGTPAYMSPEQARGEEVGRQSDIWSFGVVFYELLTGVSPFHRKSTAETLAHVLSAQPDVSQLPPSTPHTIRRLLQRCLERDPKRRLQHIGDARIEIEDAVAGQVPVESPVRVAGTRAVTWVAMAVMLLVTIGIAAWALSNGSAPRTPVTPTRVSLPFLDRPAGYAFGVSRIAISPDGSTVAYSGNDRLWIRRLDQKDAVSVGAGLNPFFSADGSSLGFFFDGRLVRMPSAGGVPTLIARHAGRPQGASWSDDGTIVFATTEGLYRVSADGGEPLLLKAPDRSRDELQYAWPEFLPGATSVMFTIVLEGAEPRTQLATLNLASRQVRVAWSGGSFARRASNGHFVFASGTTLRAIAFDPDLQQASTPATIPDIEVSYAADNGAADFALSATGTLVFIEPVVAGARSLEWIDRMGRHEPVALSPGNYIYPRISPDGTRVALDVGGRGQRDIWILELGRLALSRLSDGPTEDMLAAWSSDGKRVFFSSNRNGNFDIYSQPADGAAAARVEFAGPGDQIAETLTPDGSRLFVQENFGESTLLFDFSKPDSPQRLFDDRFDQRLFQVSPDGKWLAFESNESGGAFEIMVRSFPDLSGHRVQISNGGGRYPKWGTNGSNELYYVAADGGMMAVSITLAPQLTVGRSRKLFDFQKPPDGRTGMTYDISPVDGRFLTTTNVPTGGNSTNVSVIFNWEQPPSRLPSPAERRK